MRYPEKTLGAVKKKTMYKTTSTEAMGKPSILPRRLISERIGFIVRLCLSDHARTEAGIHPMPSEIYLPLRYLLLSLRDP